MKLSEAFHHFSDVNIALLGLGLFLFVFFGNLIWVQLKSNQEMFKKLETFPLRQDDGVQVGLKGQNNE